MSLRSFARLAPLAAVAGLALALGACTTGGGLVSTRTLGYNISEDALVQIRPGQSQALVTLVLGSPQTQNSFGDETAFYYVQTKVTRTSFGLSNVNERTVVAVYFDRNNKVVDKAVYSLQDGRVVAIESRRTPSFGEDRSFIESLIASI